MKKFHYLTDPENQNPLDPPQEPVQTKTIQIDLMVPPEVKLKGRCIRDQCIGPLRGIFVWVSAAV